MLSGIKQLDVQLYKSLSWMLDNAVKDVIFETFSVEVGQGDARKVLPLCAGGEALEVTDDNKLQYARLMLLWRLQYSVEGRLQPFLQGLHELAPLAVLREASAGELQAMLIGKKEVDVNELRAFCRYSVLLEDGLDDEEAEAEGFGEAHDLVVWLWRFCSEQPSSEVRGLLRFFTGVHSKHFITILINLSLLITVLF